MAYKANSKSSNIKRWKIPALLIFLVLLSLAALEFTDKINVLPGSDTTSEQAESNKAKTTSKRKTAQSNYTEGKVKTSSSSTDINRGGAVDNNQPVSTPTQGAETVSSTGVITLYSPSKNAKINNGSSISGKSSINPVYFRLVDSSVGIIAQGPLNVTNGLFSGTMQISPKGSNGNLELYTVDPSSGKESNHVQIDVNF